MTWDRLACAAALAPWIVMLSLSACDAAIPLTCEQVRVHVARYGRVAALDWARRNGWTEAQISEARRCLR